MRILFIVICFFLLNCKSSNKESVLSLNLKDSLSSWNSKTEEALYSLSSTDTMNKGKAEIIGASLSDSAEIDFLDRFQFVLNADSIFSHVEDKKGFIIVELRQSGEVISQVKSIILLEKRDAYLFKRTLHGEWQIAGETHLSREQCERILSAKNKLDSTYLWGSDINDIMIVTKLTIAEMKVTPIFSFPLAEMNEIKKSLFPVVDRVE